MAKGVVVVGRAAVIAGFALAGLDTREVGEVGEGARALAGLLGDTTLGVIVTEDAIYDALEPAVLREIARRSLPLVVPFPGPMFRAAAVGPEAFVVELLRQAIGYRVRLG